MTRAPPAAPPATVKHVPRLAPRGGITLKVLLLAPLLVASVLPLTASAGPDCVMAYPWSELCQGDVGGFLRGMGVDVTMECVAMSPWWELCNGDVGGVIAWLTRGLP